MVGPRHRVPNRWTEAEDQVLYCEAARQRKCACNPSLAPYQQRFWGAKGRLVTRYHYKQLLEIASETGIKSQRNFLGERTRTAANDGSTKYAALLIRELGVKKKTCGCWKLFAYMVKSRLPTSPPATQCLLFLSYMLIKCERWTAVASMVGCRNPDRKYESSLRTRYFSVSQRHNFGS